MKSKPITHYDEEVYRDWRMPRRNDRRKNSHQRRDESRFSCNFYTDWKCGEPDDLHLKPWNL